MKHIEQEIKKIQNELEQHPDDPGLLNELGVGFHLMGKYRKAVNAFEKALSTSRRPKIHFNLANSYYELEEIEQSLSHYMNALDLKPDYVPALNNLADIYELAGKQERARELFRYIAKINPEDPVGHFNLGNHYLRSDDTVEAGRCYQKTIELDPGFYEAYNNIGFILQHVGKYKEAVDYFRECLEINPNFEPARKDLKACEEAISRES